MAGSSSRSIFAMFCGIESLDATDFFWFFVKESNLCKSLIVMWFPLKLQSKNVVFSRLRRI